MVRWWDDEICWWDGEMIICLMEETAREEEKEAAGWRQKTRTPHRDVGKNTTRSFDGRLQGECFHQQSLGFLSRGSSCAARIRDFRLSISERSFLKSCGKAQYPTSLGWLMTNFTGNHGFYHQMGWTDIFGQLKLQKNDEKLMTPLRSGSFWARDRWAAACTACFEKASIPREPNEESASVPTWSVPNESKTQLTSLDHDVKFKKNFFTT